MSLLSKYWKAGVSLLFGIGIFLFWWRAYPVMLSFQEQYQLFLYDGTYLAGLLSVPDGFCRAIGEWLVQYHINQALGAFIMAVLFVLIQRLVWRLMAARGHYLLSFLPPLLLLLILGDENVMMTFVIALTVTLVAMWVYQALGAKWWVALMLMPVVYWLAGPVVLMLAAFVVVRQWQTASSKWVVLMVGVSVVIFALVCILVSAWWVPYPVSRLFYGVDYYRFPEVYYWLLACMMVLVVIVTTGVRYLPVGQKTRIAWLVGTGEAVVLLVAFLLLRPSFYDSRKYEALEYDYLVRCNDWQTIIAKAERKTPDLPMTVCATNLALGMTGQLGERAFDFFQNGLQGLLPTFERTYTTLFITGEAYWQLGMVNTAQRFAFEAMEAIPNYGKSCRAVKRLAETNLVNGQYEVARKYLLLLEKTRCYRQWARRVLPLLGDEKKIDQHPLYGPMRQHRLENDFLFSEPEMDKMLGQLVVRDHSNSLAVQYLLLAPLLERDVNKFMDYMTYVDGLYLGYRPRSCQEGIAYAYAQRRQQPPQGYVSEQVLRQWGDFVRAVKTNGQGSPQVEMFRHTVWYYLVR